MIRLIGIDVDGTLLDSRGNLPDANRDAVAEAVAAGIHVALVTGRSYPYARPVADPLPDALTLIVSNGAVERAMDGRTLARRLLDRRVARAVLEVTRPFRDQTALIFDRDRRGQIVFESMDWDLPNRRSYWARNHRLIDQAVPLEDALDEDPIQVMLNGGSLAMRALAADLRAAADGFTVSLTEYLDRDFSLIDITAPDASKGQALAWRARELGIGRDEVMAVGDNFNDVEMLEYAGTPVLMGNAVTALFVRGWRVTDHQDDAGLATAIRRWALP